MTKEIQNLIEDLLSDSPYRRTTAETTLLRMCKPLMDTYLDTCKEFGYVDYERCSTAVFANLRKPYGIRYKSGLSKQPFLSIISEAENPDHEEAYFYMPIQWLDIMNPEEAIRDIAKNKIRSELLQQRSTLFSNLKDVEERLKKLDETFKD